VKKEYNQRVEKRFFTMKRKLNVPYRQLASKDQLLERNDFARYMKNGFCVPKPSQLLGVSDSLLDSMHYQAIAYLKYHDTQDAEDSFRLLCKLRPYDPEYWYGLAQALREEGKYEEALSAACVAETIDPFRLEFYEEAINSCLEASNPKMAHAIFKRMSSLFRKFPKDKENARKIAILKEVIKRSLNK